MNVVCRGALRVDIHTGCCGAEQRWKELEAAKRIMPKALTFQDMTPQQLREELPVRVISLARATERRTKLIKTLDAAGTVTSHQAGPHVWRTAPAELPWTSPWLVRYQQMQLICECYVLCRHTEARNWHVQHTQQQLYQQSLHLMQWQRVERHNTAGDSTTCSYCVMCSWLVAPVVERCSRTCSEACACNATSHPPQQRKLRGSNNVSRVTFLCRCHIRDR
jgi:phosphoketolase